MIPTIQPPAVVIHWSSFFMKKIKLSDMGMGRLPTLIWCFWVATLTHGQFKANSTLVQGRLSRVFTFAGTSTTLAIEQSGRLYITDNDSWSELALEHQSSNLVVGSCSQGAQSSKYLLLKDSEFYTATSGAYEFNLTQRGASLALYEISCHPHNPRALLGLVKSAECLIGTDACHSQLHVSYDFGATWRFLRAYVVEASWKLASSLDDNTIAFVYFANQEGNSFSRSRLDLQFAVSSDLLVTERLWFARTPAFRVARTEDGSFIVWVGVVQQSNALMLYVSKDRAQSFEQVSIPGSMNPNSFTLLDEVLGSVFLAVDYVGMGADSRVDVFYSDVWDGIFNSSLLRLVAASWTKVESLRGAYVATQARSDNEGIHSVVTWDMGQTWTRIGNLRVFELGSLLSPPNATGLLVGIGLVGLVGPPEDLRPDLRTFVSRSGGKSWEAVLPDAFSVVSGPTGRPLVAVAMQRDSINSVMVSIDEGLTWTEYQLGIIAPIVQVTSFSAINSNRFLLSGTVNASHSLLVTIETPLPKRMCMESDDFELFESPVGCVLGANVTYRRRKAESDCQLSDSFDRIFKVSPCLCQRHDFTCNTCYAPLPTDSGVCIRESDACVAKSQPALCIYTFVAPPAYRKRAANECTAGVQVELLSGIVEPCGYSAAYIAIIAATVLVGMLLIAVVVVVFVRRRGCKWKNEEDDEEEVVGAVPMEQHEQHAQDQASDFM